jgi:RHS repeat-associated protein
VKKFTRHVPIHLLWIITTPDQGLIQYGYDAAHRLASITNGAGEKIVYTRDNFSRITQEQTFAANSAVASTTLNRKFDGLGRLWQLINAANQTAQVNLYDKQGNLTSQTAKVDSNTAHDQISGFTYDDLNRVETLTDALNGLSTLTHDGRDRVTNAEDPRLHSASYTLDGLDNLQQDSHPDRGTINNSVIDEAGNIKTSTDARNHTTQSVYDALNRATRTSYDDNTAVSYQYDTGTGAADKLNRIIDSTGRTTWQFDTEGRLLNKKQLTGGLLRTTAYTYDSATGRPNTVTYPSGAIFKYFYDAAGRPNLIKYAANAQTAFTTLIDTISYQPLGGVKSYRLPTITGKPTLTWGYDSDGRISSYPVITASGGLASKSLIRDLLGNITTLGDTGNTSNDQHYSYDALNRLTDYSAAALGISQSYSYDALGNRTNLTANGNSTALVVNPGSNRLDMVGSTNYTYDSSGNTTNNGSQSFTYDAKGRLSGTTKNNIAYSYGINGLGQRVSKTSTALSSGGRVYVYDEPGHLLGEYDTSGATQREYLYLGDRPVAAFAADGSAYPIISDHLGTPRQAVNSQAQTVWQWGNTDPFGNAAANTNPQGLGNFYFPLRFPGQTLDDESGLFYNYFRDYDPKLGRYAESDPVGLRGGFNTYGYVNGNPINWVDILGLTQCDIDAAFKFAKNKNSDLIFPSMEMVHTVPGSDQHLQHPNPALRNPLGNRAATIYFPSEERGIWINGTRYGGKLNAFQAGDLLEVASHEAWHWNNGEIGRWYTIDNLDYAGSGRPYDEGKNRTPTSVRNEFNTFRRKCGC